MEHSAQSATAAANARQAQLTREAAQVSAEAAAAAAATKAASERSAAASTAQAHAASEAQTASAEEHEAVQNKEAEAAAKTAAEKEAAERAWQGAYIGGAMFAALTVWAGLRCVARRRRDATNSLADPLLEEGEYEGSPYVKSESLRFAARLEKELKAAKKSQDDQITNVQEELRLLKQKKTEEQDNQAVIREMQAGIEAYQSQLQDAQLKAKETDNLMLELEAAKQAEITATADLHSMKGELEKTRQAQNKKTAPKEALKKTQDAVTATETELARARSRIDAMRQRRYNTPATSATSSTRPFAPNMVRPSGMVAAAGTNFTPVLQK